MSIQLVILSFMVSNIIINNLDSLSKKNEKYVEKEVHYNKPLREIARGRNFNIGVLFGGYGYHEYYKQLIDIQVREFNLSMQYLDMRQTQPNKKEYYFVPTDNDIPHSIKNGMKILGHPLIWYAAVPDWIKNGNYSRSELIDIMINHIQTVMSRYKHKISAWIVVNEAYIKPEEDLFYNVIGPEYVDIAFRTARDVDSSAILIYNEFDNHTPNGRFTEHTRIIVERLKSKNLIDAVGLQMHLKGHEAPKKEEVVETMQSYGLPIYVTEFDVNISEIKGTQKERFNVQANIYKDMIEAAFESGVCKDFIIFGIVDKLSIWESSMIYGGNNYKSSDPTPFDDNFQPKPAYYSILDALSKY